MELFVFSYLTYVLSKCNVLLCSANASQSSIKQINTNHDINVIIVLGINVALNTSRPPSVLPKKVPKEYWKTILHAYRHNFKVLAEANKGPDTLFTSAPITEKAMEKLLAMSLETLVARVNGMRLCARSGVVCNIQDKFDRKNSMLVHHYSVLNILCGLDWHYDGNVNFVNNSDDFLDEDNVFFVNELN